MFVVMLFLHHGGKKDQRVEIEDEIRNEMVLRLMRITSPIRKNECQFADLFAFIIRRAFFDKSTHTFSKIGGLETFNSIV